VIAVISGKPVTIAPTDLFIPPDALEILLDSFTGPLDLLLYLIRRENMDIMDISMVLITKQYMQYIELMEVSRMELAADYLVMAAMLAEIKSRLLLPVIVREEEGTVLEDPRKELIRRLLLYEQFKQAALTMDALPRRERDIFSVYVNSRHVKIALSEPQIALNQLVSAMMGLSLRKTQIIPHQIEREPLSVSERMTMILERLEHHSLLTLCDLFLKSEGRKGLVVSLLAVLELAKQSRLIVMQRTLFSPIYLKGCEHDG